MVRDGAGAPPHHEGDGLGCAALSTPSLRAKRSNPESLRGGSLDCFVASLLAMTMHQIAATQTDDPGHQTHLRTLAACFARALLQLPTLLSKRAQGRPGAGRHPWPLC